MALLERQDEGAALIVQVVEEGHDLGAGGRVEVAGGFVGEDDARFVGQSAGEGYALAFAA